MDQFHPCTLRQLPECDQHAAAMCAISLNPVNRPAPHVERARIGVLTTKYWRSTAPCRPTWRCFGSKKGKAVWDYLRIRGTSLGHQHPYYLVSGPQRGAGQDVAPGFGTRKWEETPESAKAHGQKVLKRVCQNCYSCMMYMPTGDAILRPRAYLVATGCSDLEDGTVKNDPKREEQTPRTPRNPGVALIDRIDRLVGKSNLPVKVKVQCLQFVLAGVQMDVLDEPATAIAKP